MYLIFLYISLLHSSGFLKSSTINIMQTSELQLLIFKGEIVSHVLVIVYFISISQFFFSESSGILFITFHNSFG